MVKIHYRVPTRIGGKIIIHRQKPQNTANNMVRFLQTKGNDLLKSELYDGAIDYFKKILIQSPHDVRAHNSIGKALFRKGEFDEAEKIFRSHPEDIMSLHWLRNTLIAKKLFGEAEQIFSKIQKFEFINTHALNELGKRSYEENDLDIALYYINRLTKLEPRDYVAYDLKGKICMAMNNLDEAKKAFECVREIKEGDWNAYRGLAKIALAERKYGAAVGYFKKIDGLRTLSYINIEDYSVSQESELSFKNFDFTIAKIDGYMLKNFHLSTLQGNEIDIFFIENDTLFHVRANRKKKTVTSARAICKTLPG